MSATQEILLYAVFYFGQGKTGKLLAELQEQGICIFNQVFKM